ncbi:MAG: GntR family transcriptional regulator [Firmicutes bacterium]|nr:GntR family transcriptional regulator [Bacillota bacterium]
MDTGGSLKRFTLRRRIYEMVKEQILNQSIPPGTRIMEGDISEELGVSRTPVREAMSQLERDGLVRVEPRRGIFVKEVCEKDIIDVCEVREVLEALAIRKAAALASDEQVQELRAISQEYADAYLYGEHSQCITLDRKFHETLAAIAGNGKLEELIGEISDLVQMTRLMDCRYAANFEATIAEHNEIIEAVAAHNVDAAAVALEKHMRRVKGNLISSITRDKNSGRLEAARTRADNTVAREESSVS